MRHWTTQSLGSQTRIPQKMIAHALNYYINYCYCSEHGADEICLEPTTQWLHHSFNKIHISKSTSSSGGEMLLFLAVTAATKNRMQIKAGAYESCNCVIKTSCVANIRSETSRNVEAWATLANASNTFVTSATGNYREDIKENCLKLFRRLHPLGVKPEVWWIASNQSQEKTESCLNLGPNLTTML